MIKNAKKEKSDLTLSTYVQYVEEFKFWDIVAGRHRILEKKIAKCYFGGLKRDIFREVMYSRTFETLDDVVREAREEFDLSRYFRNFGS